MPWHIKRGLVAAAVAILFIEAVAAGASRDCMPSFDLNILAGQLILFTMFGAPMIVVVAAAAFVAAALPSVIRTSGLVLIGGAIATAAIVLATPKQIFVVAPVGGAFVGIFIRATQRYQRWWLPAAIAIAFCVAGGIFGFGHYGQDNCYP